MVENVRVARHQPCQRACIFLGVLAGIAFDSYIRCGRAVLEQLTRHGLEIRGCYKRLPHTPHPRRTAPLARSFLLGGRSSLTMSGLGRDRARLWRVVKKENSENQEGNPLTRRHYHYVPYSENSRP